MKPQPRAIRLASKLQLTIPNQKKIPLEKLRLIQEKYQNFLTPKPTKIGPKIFYLNQVARHTASHKNFHRFTRRSIFTQSPPLNQKWESAYLDTLQGIADERIKLNREFRQSLNNSPLISNKK